MVRYTLREYERGYSSVYLLLGSENPFQEGINTWYGGFSVCAHLEDACSGILQAYNRAMLNFQSASPKKASTIFISGESMCDELPIGILEDAIWEVGELLPKDRGLTWDIVKEPHLEGIEAVVLGKE